MFYGIFALIVFSVILVLAEYQKRYCWFFLIMSAGMILSFFSLSMHLNKFGNYSYSSNILFSLDYWVLSWVSRTIKLPLSTLNRLMNVGIAVYLLAVPLFVYDFIHDSTSSHRQIILLVLLMVYNIWFYDPSTAYRIYISSHHQSYPGLYSKIIPVLHRLNQVWILVYFLYPLLLLYRYLMLSSVRFIRHQIFLLASCLGVLNILFYSIFFVSPFMMSPDKAITRGFWIFENIQMVYTHFYPIITVALIVILIVTLILLLNYRLGSIIHIFTDRKIRRDLFRMNEILSDMLHSEKNLLFSIQILASRAEQARSNPSLCLKNVEKIRELTDLSLKKTSETLNSIRSLRYQFRENNLIAAMEEALAKAGTEDGTSIIWNKTSLDPRLYKCYFDYYHINQVFINVLNNAAEAIHGAGRKDGSILIKASVQFQWIITIIQDNGTGIKKTDLKRLFVPYSSRKADSQHWGLGLSYVYKVVKSHRGQIHIETKWGEGTAVQIMLPLWMGAGK